jgi:ATP adenylyltransferase
LESEVDDCESYIIHRGQHVFAIMNSYPYAVGHFMVVPYRQVAELSALSSDESVDLWATVTEGVSVARKALAPHGVNVGVNLGAAAGGSVNEHLHVHVVSRWLGDNNFLVATANTKSISEALDVTAERLRQAWRDHRVGQ